MNVGTQSNKPDVFESVEGCLNVARNGCLWLFGNVFLAAFLIWGIVHAYSSWQLVSSGGTATGTVVAFDEFRSDGSTTYKPIIEFTANGQSYSFEGGNSSNPPAYDIGEEVGVLYDPAAPEQARVESFYELWLFPSLIIPIMLLTLLIVNIIWIITLLRGRMTHADHGTSS